MLNSDIPQCAEGHNKKNKNKTPQPRSQLCGTVTITAKKTKLINGYTKIFCTVFTLTVLWETSHSHFKIFHEWQAVQPKWFSLLKLFRWNKFLEAWDAKTTHYFTRKKWLLERLFLAMVAMWLYGWQCRPVFDPDWNTLTTIGWIVMKSCITIHGAQRMNSDKSGDPQPKL